MSQQSSNEPPKGPHGVSRRRFVQSTALLTGLSIGGKQLVEPAPAAAQEHVADVRIAQTPPMPTPRAAAVAIAPAPQAAAAPPISLQDFIKLSRVLTGFDDLESELAEQYLERCTLNVGVQPLLKPMVDALSGLAGSRSEIEKSFLAKLQADNGRLFVGAEQIIYLWYVGGFFQPGATGGPPFWDYGPPEHFFNGKAWTAIGVRPPISARGHVYWSKPGTEV
jgi:hypothetical protein